MKLNVKHETLGKKYKKMENVCFMKDSTKSLKRHATEQEKIVQTANLKMNKYLEY